MLTRSQKLFIFGCIPVRILLAYFTKQLSPDKLKILGFVLLVVGSGFLYLYFTKGRMNAPEAGGVTWWNQFRIVHGSLYLTAAILAIKGNSNAWVPLAIDVIVGIIVSVAHYT
jgi:hypothetical protein